MGQQYGAHPDELRRSAETTGRSTGFDRR